MWFFSSDLRYLTDWGWPDDDIYIRAALVKGEGTEWNVFYDDEDEARFLETLYAPSDSSGKPAVITQVIICAGPDWESSPASPAPIEEPRSPSCADVEHAYLFARQEGADITPGEHPNEHALWTISEDKTTLALDPAHTDIGVIVKGVGVDGANLYARWYGGSFDMMTPPTGPDGEPTEIEYFEVCSPMRVNPNATCSDFGKLVFARQEGADITPGEHSNAYASWTISEDKTALTLESTRLVAIESVLIKGVDPDWRFTEAEVYWFDDGFTDLTPPPGPDGEPVAIEYFEVCAHWDTVIPTPSAEPTERPTAAPAPTTAPPTEEPVPTGIPSGQVNGTGIGGADGTGSPAALIGLLVGTGVLATSGLLLLRRSRR